VYPDVSQPAVADSRPHNGDTTVGDPRRAARRLGDLVVARRVQLGYRKRPPFAQASGISTRILGDIETGRRTNFGPSTIAALEHTLQWATGSVAAVLAGGDPTVFDTHPQPPPGGEPDEAVARVMRSDLPDEQKRHLVRLLNAEREAAERWRIEHAEELIRLLRGQG
jgi:hypothetical protein